MSLIETRSGGNVPGLPGTMSLGALSRRAAMLGAVTIAGFSASFAKPAVASVAIVGAVTSSSADAHLIDLAGRVETLAQRCAGGGARRRALEDRVRAAWPWPEDPPYPTSSEFSIEETAAGRVVTAIIPKAKGPALVEWTQAKEDARIACIQGRKAMEARIGLSRAYRRGSRMRRRLSRWSIGLVSMQPATAAGLAAKSAAAAALFDDLDAVENGSPLARAVLADAMRLGTGASA